MASPSVFSGRDLSVLPAGIFTQDFVDSYLKSKSKASGEQHISKGYKYFHEQFLRDRQSKYCTVTVVVLIQ